ncbi:hypothetical protein KQH49_08925 [Mycetohabitans sp. B5]|uniref:Uncharacterized protein n=1 Tax=Mycetohabitans endofungorum TaxID=417203 RepID=A0A2P5K7F0_9BURK|nr:hypothetical protein [Mycetohabitans sp. B5]PPB81445.1 hypothetical protein B0O95_11918 [Mycetohabitans endofungorum]
MLHWLERRYSIGMRRAPAMIEILAQYPHAYLHRDGYQLFGRAVIAWLLAASLAIGFTLFGPLPVVRVSANRWLSVPVGVFMYVIRGTRYT